jgi:hypothetical protein
MKASITVAIKINILIFAFCVGCRCMERYTSEKPKIKNKFTTGFEAGTNLYAEGFGPTKHDPKRPSSPYECVNLKWRTEYGIEW